ncbi:MAG: hypothetical protein V2A79_10010 [Planctomycetota bacterium]
MKALSFSLWQPWASAIAVGAKQIETPLPEPIPYKGRQGLFEVPDGILCRQVANQQP